MKANCSFVALIIVGAPLPTRADDAKTVGRIFHSMVWTGKEVLVWGGGAEGVFHSTGLRIDPFARSREAIADDSRLAGRWGHAAVWSGSEMLIWGGRGQFQAESHFDDGGRYNPATGTWSTIKSLGSPTGRSQMAAVWTGEEMIVWGGYGDHATAWNTGARYNPRTDSWRPMSEVNAPEARVVPVYAWTGKELLVCGGITPDLKRTMHTGARYNPASDTWTPMKSSEVAPPVWGSKAVWTGTEILVWGGSHRNGDDEINQVIRTGAAYDPIKNSWRSLSTDGAPAARFFHDAVWTGRRMIVWGGGDQGGNGTPPKHFDDGGAYDPLTDSWTPLVWENRPSGRGMHSAIWTGRAMMVFGGSTGGSSAFSDAVTYEPK